MVKKKEVQKKLLEKQFWNEVWGNYNQEAQ